MQYSRISLAILATSLLAACGGGSSSSGDDSGTPPPAPSELISIENTQKVVDTNADIAFAIYSDAVTTAEALKDAIDAFAAEPTQDNLDAAKTAWLVAREPYGQTEVYRFRLSPIDSTDYDSEDGPEGDINAWPLGEALIDYVATNTTDFGDDQIGVTANGVGINGGGAVTSANAASSSASDNSIIGNINIEITADTLSNTATADDEHDVIAGYHAIEFMLWGQDLKNDTALEDRTTDGSDRDEAVKAYESGGQRPLSDFTEATFGERRLTFLQVAVDKLIADLEGVRDGWAEGADYRTAFTTIESEADAKQKLAEILTGMGTLSEGELAGERMQIAFSSNSQEDEHSCFSDNTHRDIWLNAEGVSNSYYGEYAGYDSDLDGVDDAGTRVSGYGLDDYLSDAGLSDLDVLISAALTVTKAGYEGIDELARDGMPFDVQIMEENQNSDSPVYQTIYALNAQSGVIADIAEELGLDADVVDDEASECDTTNPDEECGG
ncbi:MAG: peptidase, imelysin family protein [Oceanospirillaceae bacterium]|nr:peptidase, imelysin family protein [Oceanospirillaceae bacterium]|tara:strand:+ start:33957 stop:35444 length:1488 start_codon:yes stop_codon:yes gene_type:complete